MGRARKLFTFKIFGKSKYNEPNQAQKIYDLLMDQATQAQAFFFKYTLNFFNSFNAKFQSKGLTIHKLYASIKLLTEQFAFNFFEKEARSSIFSTDFNISENVESLENIYLDPSCAKVLQKNIKRKCYSCPGKLFKILHNHIRRYFEKIIQKLIFTIFKFC